MPVRSRPSSGPSSGSARDEPDRRRHLAQVVGAVDEAPVLDRDAHPDVRRPLEPRRKLGEALVALREDLERVPVASRHHLEDLLDEARAGSSSWKRSLIELTKIIRGRRHRSG